MKLNTIAAAFVLSALLVSTSAAANIDYKILINGVEAGQHVLSAGEHTLEVQGRVTDNDIVAGTPGGFIQASFDLIKDALGVEFVQGRNFLDQPDGLWKSESNTVFANHNKGAVDAEGNIIQETGSILQAQWGAEFNTVGTQEYSFIASGPFTFDGTTDTNISLTSVSDVNLVAGLNGGNIGAAIPDGTIMGSSTLITGIPEPTSIMLAGLGMIGFIAKRRRS